MIDKDAPLTATHAARHANSPWRDRTAGLRHRLDVVAIFVVGLACILGLEDRFRGAAVDRIYFQQWNSERLMQTVAIEDLQAAPLESLWYLHIQPPLLDGLRAAIAASFPEERGPALVQKVDRTLYTLWGIAYALIGALVYRWLSLLSHQAVGVFGWLVLLLHPAMIFYATLLDSTALSALASTWLLFEVWRLGTGTGRGGRLSAALILAFLTRSVFQWPALVVVLTALLLARVPWRHIAVVAAVAGTVVLAFTTKQMVLFDLPYTSSFAGLNLCRSIGTCDPLTEEEVRAARKFLDHHPEGTAASVLSRTRKLVGDNLNALSYLEEYKRQLLAYRKTMTHKTVGQLFWEYTTNFRMFLQPSSRFTPHIIVDRLPWREEYDAVFSGRTLLLLLVASVAVWLAQHRRRPDILRGAGLAMVCGYIAAVSILFERGENQRFKFFVEPAVLVLVLSQAAAAGSALWRYRCGRTPR